MREDRVSIHPNLVAVLLDLFRRHSITPIAIRCFSIANGDCLAKERPGFARIPGHYTATVLPKRPGAIRFRWLRMPFACAGSGSKFYVRHRSFLF